MNQDDQRYVLMAAAAQAHYAKQQARREARKAALLSQVSALSNSSQPMDPKLQAELERLIRAEAQRTEQENFDWDASRARARRALDFFGRVKDQVDNAINPRELLRH